MKYIRYILLVSAIFTHTVAAYLLIKKRNKKVMHLLLINLVLTELVFIIQELAMLSLFHPMVYTKIRMTIKHVLIFSMHSGIVLITLDRVAAVHFSLAYNAIVSKKRMCVAISAFSWNFAVTDGSSKLFCHKLGIANGYLSYFELHLHNLKG